MYFGKAIEREQRKVRGRSVKEILQKKELI